MSELDNSSTSGYSDYFEKMHKIFCTADIVCILVNSIGIEETAKVIEEANICPIVPSLQLIDIYTRNRLLKGVNDVRTING
jgi:hypothetical protein